ncbi:MAG: hypothetical protein WC637_17870, partial [Victivallales bacterium]
MLFEKIATALEEQRYETARRLCQQAMADCPAKEKNKLLFLTHAAYLRLGDRPACERTLNAIAPANPDEQLEVALRQADDCRFFSSYSFYRVSEEGRQGYSVDEYKDMLQKKMDGFLAQAKAVADSPERRAEYVAALKRCCRDESGKPVLPAYQPTFPVPPAPPRQGSARLYGRLTFSDGRPVAATQVTLGLPISTWPYDPKRYTNLMEHNYAPDHSPLQVVTTVTSDAGDFEFKNLPQGIHPFLAVNLDPDIYPMSVRFVGHDIAVQSPEQRLDAIVADWTAGDSVKSEPDLPLTVKIGKTAYARVGLDRLNNPFDFYFHRQLLEIPLTTAGIPDPASLILVSDKDLKTPLPFQLRGNTLLYLSDLAPLSSCQYAVYQSRVPSKVQPWPSMALVPDADHRTAVLDTGRASFRVPFGNGNDALAPILAVKGADGQWRGSGRLVIDNPELSVSRETRIVEDGPLVSQIEITYQIGDSSVYTVRLTFHRDEAYVLVHELSPELAARFDFSLNEFLDGRGYLHWKPEGGDIHWTDLKREEKLLARLEEMVPWWCPPEGFGYAMTSARHDEHDMIGVCTIRRGEWIDRRFAVLSEGPGPKGYDLDWPQPEMVGSTISMITAQSTGDDCFFRFKLFDGERHWALMVLERENNDGPFKEMSAIQHKNSHPRLQEFKYWDLDRTDTLSRPQIMLNQEQLPGLRQRRDDPRFRKYWDRIMALRPSGGGQHYNTSVGSFRALINADPAAIWLKKRELVSVSRPHSRTILLGRDFYDEYSPVGTRMIAPWVEDYDTIAGTGVFTAAEERLVRAHLMLMGHMCLHRDFMNWRFKARNANFEADRVDAVGTVGICFSDTPSGKRFIEHALDRLAVIISSYCTPGSGKWYENPPCYYLQSVKCWTNLIIHLAQHRLLEPSKIPRIKEFLNWPILILTAPTPSDYKVMCKGGTAEEYERVPRVRRIPPIGDHAHLGTWISEHFILLARYFKTDDPGFADRLRWAYHACGADGGFHGHPQLFFAMADEWDLKAPPADQVTLPSRKLTGFGSVFRGNFNRPDEFYLLFKLGPGGYRYHRTEGSIILCADGKPLIYDGGENGEAWRHSTLSFYDTHTMLAPGHIERFASLPGLDFSQGVNPKALAPGEPDFLCNSCRHELVELAWERFREPHPENARALFWVKDDYVVMRDQLRVDQAIPRHWHLQVVAESESGDLTRGYRFNGRFGTDLQVLLPGMESAAAQVTHTPIVEPFMTAEESFAMRHMQVTPPSTVQDIWAVLRPLPSTKSVLSAALLKQTGATYGVRVQGDGIDDFIFGDRNGVVHSGETVTFNGLYGAFLSRPKHFDLLLLDGESISCGQWALEGKGVMAQLHVTGTTARLTAIGSGLIVVRGPNGRRRIKSIVTETEWVVDTLCA